jgi:lysophospholipase L1-like esterase
MLGVRVVVLTVIAGLLGACADEPDSTPPAPMPTVAATPRGTATPAPAPATSSPTSSPTARPEPRADGVYLALGDSVTFGVGAPQPSRQGYPALLLERLRAAGSSIGEAVVFAVPGETAAGFLDSRIDDVEAVIDELGERVELVAIGLGANEILRIRRSPPCVDDRASAECQRIANDAADEAAVALDGVVERVQRALDAAGSDARVLLLAYYNPDVEPVAASTIVGGDGVVACVPDDPAPGLNDRIACVAERRGTGLVDLYDAFLGREEELTGIGAGDVHPNPEGYVVIADAIAEELGLPPQTP